MMTSDSISLEREEAGAMRNLINQATQSVKWAFLYNAVPRLVTPFSSIILAALLTPTDFGLVAVSTLVIALAQILVDMGLGKAVVQRQTFVDEAASLSLWLSLSVSAALYGALWCIAPWIASVYGSGEVAAVLRVAGLVLPLSASISIPTALMQRNMEFRRLFLVRSSFLITQAMVSVCLALAGIGYWAMILGQLAGWSTSAGLAWGLVRWRPRFVLNRSLASSVVGFSVWVMASSFQTWLFLYADNAIAGRFLGIGVLGVYSLGFNISTLIPGFFVAAIGDVAYPTFCRLQESPRVVGQNLLKLQTLVAAILFPVAFGVSAVAQPVVKLLYGNKWPELGVTIGLLVIMPGLSYIWSLNGKAYAAVGRPDVWTMVSGFALLVLLPLLWVAAPHGLPVFTVTRFGGAMLVPFANLIVANHVLGIGFQEQIEAFVSPLLISLVMFALVFSSLNIMGPLEGTIGCVKLLGVVASGALGYLFLTRQMNRRLWDQLIFALRRVILINREQPI